jgi:hypothetical protein
MKENKKQRHFAVAFLVVMMIASVLAIIQPVAATDDPCCDLDVDGNCDYDDYELFVSTYGAQVGDLEYIDAADCDGDGRITINDYLVCYECYKEWGGELLATVESAYISGTQKDIFQPGESVYAIGSGYTPDTLYDLYIVDDTTWTDGMAIPVRVASTEISVTTDAYGNIAAVTLVWASSVIGKYDIVVDVGKDGYYNASIDALDDMDVSDAGFEAIPEFSTIAIPVASILGLLFFFNYRKRRREQ